MKRLLASYADYMSHISVFVGHSCSILYFTCIAILALEVVLRYGFDSPTVWSTELAMTLCATAWIMSVGYVTERNRHISITMLEMLVAPRVWRLFRLLQQLIAFGAILVLTLALWKPAMKVLGRTEYSGTALNSIQPTIFKVMMVVGCILYMAQLVANIIRWVQKDQEDISVGN